MRSLLATNADEALHLLQQCQNESDPVRIMLIDYGMPMIGGINLIEQVRKQTDAGPEIIVMLRSTEQRDGAAACHALGIEHYLVKPLRNTELRNALLRAINAKATTPIQKASTTMERTGLNILVAEDNQVNQLVMQRLLTKRGHRVTIAANGNLACEANRLQRFDVIFMDVQMPEMDGFEATAVIRSQSSTRVPIIALTAHAMSGDQERCIAAGMDGYMSKPIIPAELDAMLEKYGSSQIPARDSGQLQAVDAVRFSSAK